MDLIGPLDVCNHAAQMRSRIRLSELALSVASSTGAPSDVTVVMSPRTVISWAENYRIFGSLDYAFETAFLNRCDESERAFFGEYYQRCFGQPPSIVPPAGWVRVD